jgi:hypothetical protein
MAKKKSKKPVTSKGVPLTIHTKGIGKMTQKIISGNFEELKRKVRILQLKCNRTPSEEDEYVELRDQLNQTPEGRAEAKEFLDMARKQQMLEEELNKLYKLDVDAEIRSMQEVETTKMTIEKYEKAFDDIEDYFDQFDLRVYGESECIETEPDSVNGDVNFVAKAPDAKASSTFRFKNEDVSVICPKTDLYRNKRTGECKAVPMTHEVWNHMLKKKCNDRFTKRDPIDGKCKAYKTLNEVNPYGKQTRNPTSDAAQPGKAGTTTKKERCKNGTRRNKKTPRVRPENNCSKCRCGASSEFL